jgi:hypothetical protein
MVSFLAFGEFGGGRIFGSYGTSVKTFSAIYRQKMRKRRITHDLHNVELNRL